MKDYYQILGIARDATKDEIKKAYRDLAHKYHPDKKGGNEDRFKEINEAYHTLTDDQKRAQYDRFGKTFDQTAWGGDFSGWSRGGEGGQGFEDFGGAMHDIFEDFFGFGSRQGEAKRGRDIALDLEISFEEAVFGVERRVLLRKIAACEICGGTGVAAGAKEITCGRCKGSGTIHSSRRSLFGSITRLAECTACRGRGKIPERVCETCHGKGTLPKSGEVVIGVPSGVKDGEMIRLEGEGEAVTNGVAGDLYVRIHVRPHKTLRRMGRDLLMKMDIPLSQALLGGERDVETLDGSLKIKIPAGVAEGEVLKVRGKGIPSARRAGSPFAGGEGSRGDLLIEIHVRYPQKISPHAKKLVEELRGEGW